MAELSYKPRPQFLDFHQRTERFACIVAHRRCGKTVASVNELLIRALYTPKTDARYAYIAPFYRQAKDVAWSYLKEAARPFINSDKDIRESELRVKLINGSWITLYGSDNPDTLRGIYLDGVVIDEIGDARPTLWEEVVLPTLADRQGWAVFIGTPKGKNHYYRINERAKEDPNWFQLTLKASTTNILTQEDLTEMKAQMSDDQYEQELECSFEAAVLGTYYASIINMIEQNQQTARQSLYDPNFPVSAACDLGFTDSTAFWFWQIKPDGLAIIDHYEAHSQPLQHYFDHLHSLPYVYDTIWLPHDARAKTLQTGRSTIEQFLINQFPCKITPSLKLQHGIDAARLVLPLCYFDQKADEGLEALRAYRRNYDAQTKSFAATPKHDWSSHSADAFRYLSLVVRTSLDIPDPDKVYKTAKVSQFKPKGFTLDELYADRDSNAPKLSIQKMRI
ncbi:MAG: hypothetical protein DRQ42_00570 [Gammaproteobacteria bacterium]|nr:MAG: hypothetical protein DRQ42_00570 [Gammaproteobacteria bacterium]